MSGYISVFDMLKIGVGPSSSHTLGPWQAARQWRKELEQKNIAGLVNRIRVYLYGSLALTGLGHATDKAIAMGLLDENPETIDTTLISQKFNRLQSEKIITLGEGQKINFDCNQDLVFLKNETLPYHSNAMKFQVWNNSELIQESVFYSTGGGFIVREGEQSVSPNNFNPIHLHASADELNALCTSSGKLISEVVFENEKRIKPEEEIRSQLINIWKVMKEAAYTGCHSEGLLPGGLNVKRRAFELNRQLLRVHNYTNADEWMDAMKVGRDFHKVITRISCLAIAVNEVNASMGRIVTAPTNGSAGVIPAVLFYYLCFSGQETTDDDIVKFLLTAAEIGKFFKKGATISAAAGGCQAEIGVSSSMAAAALTERMGGSVAQALMAAEIAAEHHLGLTCDPVGGLVQIPCIERNSMGAVKAITASMIALASDPSMAKVSLDNVIRTMKETAENMSSRYKETSLGGLAVNVGVNLPEC